MKIFGGGGGGKGGAGGGNKQSKEEIGMYSREIKQTCYDAEARLVRRVSV